MTIRRRLEKLEEGLAAEKAAEQRGVLRAWADAFIAEHGMPFVSLWLDAERAGVPSDPVSEEERPVLLAWLEANHRQLDARGEMLQLPAGESTYSMTWWNALRCLREVDHDDGLLIFAKVKQLRARMAGDWPAGMKRTSRRSGRASTRSHRPMADP